MCTAQWSQVAYIDLRLWQITHGNLVCRCPLAGISVHVHCLHVSVIFMMKRHLPLVKLPKTMQKHWKNYVALEKQIDVS